VRRKISAGVDGGLSGVSRCADTGARTPIGVSGYFLYLVSPQHQTQPLVDQSHSRKVTNIQRQKFRYSHSESKLQEYSILTFSRTLPSDYFFKETVQKNPQLKDDM
jgi:hypothetical protein